jgi:hypothetical protein
MARNPLPPLLRPPRKKVVHRGALITERGDVSALCYARPHPINLKMATWTIVPKAVTCPRCKAAMAKASAPDG